MCTPALRIWLCAPKPTYTYVKYKHKNTGMLTILGIAGAILLGMNLIECKK